ncbi:MAG: hypothetical protein V4581_10915 [Bacteroidota bacterium]
MKASEFLKGRNEQIIGRYKELKEKMPSQHAKKIISEEFGNLSISTIDQVIYNKKYSNSPLNK